MINRERKSFGLSPAVRKPKVADARVSSTVSVKGAAEHGFCYVRFDQKFVDFVGKKLPRGASAFDPSFLEVTQCPEGWLVEAVYVRDGKRSPLWLAESKPQWVGNLRKEVGDGCTAEK